MTDQKTVPRPAKRSSQPRTIQRSEYYFSILDSDINELRSNQEELAETVRQVQKHVEYVHPRARNSRQTLQNMLNRIVELRSVIAEEDECRAHALVSSLRIDLNELAKPLVSRSARFRRMLFDSIHDALTFTPIGNLSSDALDTLELIVKDVVAADTADRSAVASLGDRLRDAGYDLYPAI